MTTFEERKEARTAEKRRRRHAAGIANVHAGNSADEEDIQKARERNFEEDENDVDYD